MARPPGSSGSPTQSTNSAKSRSSSISNSKGRKRKFFDYKSDFSCGDEGIPKQISKWKIFDLEPLGIFYNKTFEADPTCMFDVLAKNELPFEGNSSVKQTLDSLKCKLLFDLPSLDGLPHWSMSYVNEIINQLYKNATSLRQSVITEDGMFNMALSNAFDFTQRMAFMVERLYRNKPTTKHMYTGVVGAFARMCFLQDELGKVYSSGMCINDVDVVSVPDLRLKRTLLNSDEDYLSQQHSQLVVSVVEVKDNSDSKEQMCKRQTRSEMQDREEHIDVDIHELSFLDASVLGQHGGELLLEWEDSLFNPYISGMIVCGTKVVMTLLYLKKEHVDRLKNNWNLIPDEDKATIFYSKPLDMLVKEERDTLLEMFSKLNFMNRKVSAW